MTTLTLDLEQLTEALVKANTRTLPWVWLKQVVPPTDELTPPSYIPAPPAVMADFSLVDSDEYRLTYKSCRYSRFNYLLERDGDYESGELVVWHNMVMTPTIADELVPPPITTSFIPPDIYTYQTAGIGGVGSLGVLFSFIHDESTDGTEPKFGLAFKITNASPAVYPKLTMSYISTFAPEDI
jgi:hypothetical protein